MADFFGDELEGLKKKMKWGLKDIKHFDSKTESPLMNVKHSPDRVFVKFKLPGVSQGDIHLKITDEFLEVMADRKNVAEAKVRGMTASRGQYSRFYRRISLPVAVSHKSAKVDFSRGVLKISLRKK